MRKYLAGALLAAIVAVAGSAWAWDDMAGGYGTATLDGLYCKLAGCSMTGAIDLDGQALLDGGTWSLGAGRVSTVLNAATGDQIAAHIRYTTNKASSGDDYGLKISMTDTASPGTSYPLYVVVGTAPKLQMDNAGNVNFGNSISAGPIGDSSIVTIGKTYIQAASTLGANFRIFGPSASYWTSFLTSPVAIGDNVYVPAYVTPAAGVLLVETAIESQGPVYFAKKTSDPCTGGGQWKPGARFQNTSYQLCYCDGTSQDLKEVDGSACF